MLRWVAASSLVFSYLFFFEYLPPFRWVDIPDDLQYYHYSLDDFAFQSLRSRHIPEWDSEMYCGMTFAGNSQTAMFYPPMWLVFMANYGQPRLKYSQTGGRFILMSSIIRDGMPRSTASRC